MLRSQGGVQYVAPGKMILHWHAGGAVDHYYIEIMDENGAEQMSFSTTEEQTTVNTSSMQLGRTYTLFVYAIPVNGDLEDATTDAARFALEDVSVPTPTPEPEITIEPTATPEPEITDGPEITPEPEDVPEPEDIPDGEDIPEQENPEAPAEENGFGEAEYETQAPESTPVPQVTPEPAPEITPEPEPEETPEPVVEAAPEPLTAPELSFEPLVEMADGVWYVTGDAIKMQWQSEGAVVAYAIEVVNGEGQVVASTTTDQNGVAVRGSNLAPGEVYTLYVTAIPAGGDTEEGITASAKFALYVEEPLTEAAAEPEADEESEADYQAEYQAEYSDEAEKPVEKEAPAKANADESGTDEYEAYEEDYTEDYTEDDSESYAEEDETYYEEDDSEYYEEETSEAGGQWSSPVTSDSDSDTIRQIQRQLVNLGWLEGGDYEEGELDEATLQAVRDFQTFYNDNFGGELGQAMSSIDPQTLSLLMGDDAYDYANQ